jgi:uncharacterized protein YggU (UPF0235/DUF167 family)
MRIEVHVRPGSSSPAVGGTHDGALVVRVSEPADRGKATEAVLRAVADELGLSRRSVSLVRGATSRRKVISVEVPEAERESVQQRLDHLKAEGHEP